MLLKEREDDADSKLPVISETANPRKPANLRYLGSGGIDLTLFASLYLSLCPSSLSMSLCLSFSVSLFISLCLPLSVYLFLCLSVYRYLSLSLPLCVSLYLCLSLFQSLSLSLSVSLSVSFSIVLSVSTKTSQLFVCPLLSSWLSSMSVSCLPAFSLPVDPHVLDL